MKALTIGGKYNWKGQPERLIYLGCNWSGNGYWHQFEKADQPGVVWCEVLDEELHNFEETKPTAGPSARRIATRPLTEIELWNAEVERKRQEKKGKRK